MPVSKAPHRRRKSRNKKSKRQTRSRRRFRSSKSQHHPRDTLKRAHVIPTECFDFHTIKHPLKNQGLEILNHLTPDKPCFIWTDEQSLYLGPVKFVLVTLPLLDEIKGDGYGKNALLHQMVRKNNDAETPVNLWGRQFDFTYESPTYKDVFEYQFVGIVSCNPNWNENVTMNEPIYFVHKNGLVTPIVSKEKKSICMNFYNDCNEYKWFYWQGSKTMEEYSYPEV